MEQCSRTDLKDGILSAELHIGLGFYSIHAYTEVYASNRKISLFQGRHECRYLIGNGNI